MSWQGEAFYLIGTRLEYGVKCVNRYNLIVGSHSSRLDHGVRQQRGAARSSDDASSTQGERVAAGALDVAPSQSCCSERAQQLLPLHSFSNAALVSTANSGWQVVKGFAVLECVDPGLPVGSSFVAVKHWWCCTPEGQWVNVTPLTGVATSRALLVESTLGEKTEQALSAEGYEHACRVSRALLGQREGPCASGDGARLPPAAAAKPPPPPPPPSAAAKPAAAQEGVAPA